jgi:diacylglycerol kinase family enzyme
LRGFLIYLVAVMQTILLNHEAPHIHLKTDQEEIDQSMILLVACNGSREGGGFHIAPPSKPDDGVFHYVYIGPVSRPMMLRLLPEVMNGTHGRFKEVKIGTLRKAELQADRPLYIHTDGEIFAGFGMDVRQLSLEILPGAIEVIA